MTTQRRLSVFRRLTNAVADAFGLVNRFLDGMSEGFVNKVEQVAVGTWKHLFGIAILTFASYGVTALLTELPFYITLPFWIEAPMVIPVIAVIFIGLLVKGTEWQGRRNTTAA
jgi:hypothetical protein